MNQKVAPEQFKGTIQISTGQVIHVSSNAVENNKSSESSESFVKGLQKAVSKNLFQKEDGSNR